MTNLRETLDKINQENKALSDRIQKEALEARQLDKFATIAFRHWGEAFRGLVDTMTKVGDDYVLDGETFDTFSRVAQTSFEDLDERLKAGPRKNARDFLQYVI